MEQIYNKLVRDNIPDIIINNGEVPITRILSNKEYKQELEKKLYEEYQEVLNTTNTKDRIEELADLLNMERSNLTRIENGKQRPNDENIVKLAEVLNVEIKDLFDFEHFVDKKCITSNIVESLAGLNEQELQYIYKTINNIKQLR